MNVRKNRFIVMVISLAAVALCAYGIVRADLLNNQINYPNVESYGMISFDPSTGTLSTDSTQTFAWELYMSPTGMPIYFDNYSAPLSISIQTDQNGNLIENWSDTPDLTITGSITIPGVGSYSGTLLTAKCTEFGFQAANGADISYDSYDFRFTITGGLLAFLWAGDDLGVSLQCDPSQSTQPFTGSFTTAFYDYFNSSIIGGIAPSYLGCSGAVANMQIDNSQPFDTVDSNGNPINAVISSANALISSADTVTFSLNVTDCDTANATIGRVKEGNLQHWFHWFGRPKDSTGATITLTPGGMFPITQDNYNSRYAKLVQSNICQNKTYSANPIDLTFDVLLREGKAAQSVTAPVTVQCACIALSKAVSKDGGATYLNANGPCSGPNTTLKKGVSSFYFEYTISNPCAAALQNVQISDPELGINYALPGTLAAGASVVIDYHTIPALVVPPANVCQAANVMTTTCGADNTITNYDLGTATVTANAVTDPRLSSYQQPPISATAQNSANVKCPQQ